MIKNICLFLCFSNLLKAENNVCSRYSSYWFKEKSSNCWHSLDVFATPEEKAFHYDFPFEKHEVVSEDGYIISLFRIPNKDTNNSASTPVVLLVPALISDSNFYFAMGDKSIGFIFANQGYDVWFINPRGTTYSQSHTRYTIHDKNYWQFSFHEMGIYDLPATIDFINLKTDNKMPIKLITHSLGSAASFAYASLKPQHAQKHLQCIVAFAPSIFPNDGGILSAIAPFNHVIWKSLSILHLYGTSPYFNGVYLAIHDICSKYPAMKLCIFAAYLLTGYERKTDFPQRLPVFFSVWPEHTSFQTLIHVLQLHHPNTKFSYMDYGFSKNVLVYNRTTPPEYPLEHIQLPVHLFYGTNDLISGKESTEMLYQHLKTTKTINSIEGFAHLNYVMTKKAIDLYYKVVNL